LSLYGELPEVTLPNGQTARAVRIKNPNPPKLAFLRLPTSEEIITRLGQQKSIRRNLGRRKSQSESVPNLKADLALFNGIRLDKDGPEFDEYEASNAISKLTYCEVTGCERVGDEYRITLRTPFGDTIHNMRVPTLRDVSIYRKSVVSSMDLPYGQEEVRFRVEPAIDLYSAVASKIEGYAEGTKPVDVPPHHKQAVVIDLVFAIDDLDPAIDPNS